MKFLHVLPTWTNLPVNWEYVAGATVAYAGPDAKLTGHHFDEIILCMAEFQPLLRHDFTLQDLISQFLVRLKRPGRVVLDYCDPVDFFNRRPQ